MDLHTIWMESLEPEFNLARVSREELVKRCVSAMLDVATLLSMPSSPSLMMDLGPIDSI
jgi:hypothetical protein